MAKKDDEDKVPTEAERQEQQIEAQHAAAAPAEGGLPDAEGQSAPAEGETPSEDDKPEWDIRSHGPVPDGQEDMYRVVGDEKPAQDQVEGGDKQSSQQG
jgi:hypothetical protein